MYFTIQMKDAFVASVEYIMGDTRESGGERGAAAGGRQEFMRVKFAYREIHWVYANGNKEAMDKWDA